MQDLREQIGRLPTQEECSLLAAAAVEVQLAAQLLTLQVLPYHELDAALRWRRSSCRTRLACSAAFLTVYRPTAGPPVRSKTFSSLLTSAGAAFAQRALPHVAGCERLDFNSTDVSSLKR